MYFGVSKGNLKLSGYSEYVGDNYILSLALIILLALQFQMFSLGAGFESVFGFIRVFVSRLSIGSGFSGYWI